MAPEILKAKMIAAACVPVGVYLLTRFEQWLINLAKRYLPRGSRIRRWVLWSRAHED